MTELLVADSFRVRMNPETGEAEVRGFGHHLGRFSRAAWEASGHTLTDVGSFLDEARAQIADFGEGNPRLELWGDAPCSDGATGSLRLELRLRPLPELRETIALRTAGEVVRIAPTRKGPNIELFAELNRRAGAEALLLDSEGRLIEGATTGIVWWQSGALHTVENRERVPSVTEALVTGLAEANGLSVVRTSITPEALRDHETWALNALHGIRPVTQIDDTAAPAPDGERLARFRATLDASWQPVRLAAPQLR